MNREQLAKEQLYEGLSMELKKLLIGDEKFGYFDDEVTVPQPWVTVGNIDLFKAKLIQPEHKLFIKAFSPQAAEYSQAAYQALRELASTDLSLPVLPVLGRHGNALFFQEAIDRGHAYWDELEKDDAAKITHIVEKHGLEPLRMFDKLALVELDDKAYITDPFEDSAYSIDLFREKRKSA
jgi:hypothetical protein